MLTCCGLCPVGHTRGADEMGGSAADVRQPMRVSFGMDLIYVLKIILINFAYHSRWVGFKFCLIIFALL